MFIPLFIALTACIQTSSPETDRDVFEALVYRNNWEPASLLLHKDEVASRDQRLRFQWRWNLYFQDGQTIEEAFELASEQTKKLWATKNNSGDEGLEELFPGLSRVGLGYPSLERLDADQNGRFDLVVEIRNGREVIQIESVEIDGNSVVFEFPHYGSRIEASLEDDGALQGEWIKQRGAKGEARIPFRASVQSLMWCPVNGTPLSAPLRDQLEGRWKAEFAESGSAIGEFELINPDEDEMENSRLLGTFRTPTGDFRFLAGQVIERRYRDRTNGNSTYLEMSVFDGAHAFLFNGWLKDDGAIEGDFWSGNWWHETWTAVRDENAALPDAFKQTTIADEDALDDMVFKNLQGEPTRVLDVLDESNAPARIIEIFGTWCPNCSDAGRELVSLREQFGDDLAVVGLAFEVTEDFERSVQQVRHHHEHIGTDWPILIAGLSDKDKASQALPVLDKVRSYPTLIFLDRNNEVQGVYSGFSGPATGDAYIKQRERFEALIESMID
jgi:thiol-disulfide isomerase/thioredoxin